MVKKLLLLLLVAVTASLTASAVKFKVNGIYYITMSTPGTVYVTSEKDSFEFYPNPGDATVSVVSMPLAMCAEGFGTFLLALFIFALTEDCNVGRPSSDLQPVFIGLTVSSIIFFIAPLTQAGLNPARDLGPRIVAYLAGWGDAALPDASGGWFWVYVLAPIIGSSLAALFFKYVLEPINEKKNRSCGCGG